MSRDGDQQQEAFLSFARDIKATSTKLQLAVNQARTRVGKQHWQLFRILEHAIEILGTTSSGMLEISEAEHLESAGSGQDKGLPQLIPASDEWNECFLYLSQRINSLAVEISTSVAIARILEVEEKEEIFNIVESAVHIIQNVSSIIELEVGKTIIAAAFADEEDSLEELFSDEDCRKSTSRNNVKRGITGSDDEPKQKTSKVEGREDNFEGVVPTAQKLSDYTLELVTTPTSSNDSFQQQIVDAPSTPSSSPATTQNQNGSAEGSDRTTMQQSISSTTPEATTCVVQGHSINYISDRPIDVKMVGNRLLIVDRKQPNASASSDHPTESPFNVNIGPDQVHVAMEGVTLTLTPKEGTEMDGIVVSISTCMRQLEIVIPE